MNSILAIAALASAAASPAASIYVVSPDAPTSAAVLSPLLDARPLRDLAAVPAGSVVWVAAECDALDEGLGAALVKWAEGGGTLVIEDATRLAAGSLAAAAGMELRPAPATPSAAEVVHAGHPATVGVPFSAWRLLPGPRGVPRLSKAADVIVQAAAGWPVAWTTRAGAGKVVCLAAGRRRSRPVDIVGYDGFLAQLLLAASRQPASVVAEAAARTAMRAWMYLCFPAGQALYRLRAAVPADYADCRRKAIEAWKLARSNPAASLALARRASDEAARVGQWSRRFWRKVPISAVRKAAARRELLLSPGTLDFVHSMNLSVGPSGPAYVRPSSGRQLWPEDLADAAPGAATAYWRGLKPMLALSPELPLAVNPALRQKAHDGSPLPEACWLNDEVSRLLGQTVPPLAEGSVVFYCHGQPWAAASADPAGDYCAQTLAEYRALAEQAGLGPQPPLSWEPTARWLLWQKARSAHGVKRWRALAAAVHSRAANTLLVVDAGFASDPARVGPCPETGFAKVDGAAPVILANYASGFDPADVVAQVRWLVGLLDADGDGIADRWPGALARLRWADALALPPDAHALVSAVALAAGARGVLQTWAASDRWPDAALACPEDVYVRWEASFAPAIALHKLWLEASVECDAAVWRSWTSAAMANPDSPAEQMAARAAASWAALLARACFVPRLVGDDAISGGRGLAGVRVLVVPSVLCASRQSKKALGRFLASGGVVVFGPGSLAFDEHHRAAPGDPLVSPMKPRISDARGPAVALVKSKGAISAPLRPGPLVSNAWAPGARCRVVLRGRSGQPLAWSWTVGEGAAVYLACAPRADAAWAKWLGALLAAYGSRPVAAVTGGARALLCRLAGERRLLVVYNAGPVGNQERLAKVEVAVSLPPGRWTAAELVPSRPARYNAASARPVEVRWSGRRLRLTTSLQPHQVRFFMLSPR